MLMSTRPQFSTSGDHTSPSLGLVGGSPQSTVRSLGYTTQPWGECADSSHVESYVMTPTGLRSQDRAYTHLAHPGFAAMDVPIPSHSGRCTVFPQVSTLGSPVGIARKRQQTTAPSWSKSADATTSMATITASRDLFDVKTSSSQPSQRSNRTQEVNTSGSCGGGSSGGSNNNSSRRILLQSSPIVKRTYQNMPRGRRASRNKGKRRSLSPSSPTPQHHSPDHHRPDHHRSYHHDRHHGNSSPSSGSESDSQNGAVETACPHCSKSYRQNNSFYKHLYEHHPQWCHVSEAFGLSKHKQVMLMQAVDLLLAIRQPDQYAIHPLVRF